MSGTHKAPESTLPGALSEAQLLAYLEGKLSGEEQRAVELLLAEEGMESDALEGLHEFGVLDAGNAARKLNTGLEQSLKKKKHRSRRGMGEQRWAWIAIAVVLLLVAAAFAVVWIMMHSAS